MDNTHIDKMHHHNRNLTEFNKEKFLDVSKNQLHNQIKKKLETSFIGALSQVEMNFGDLWGHGLSEDELTSEQLAYRELWDICRSAILDNGNNQVRAIQNELKQYTVRWDRYKLNLPTKPLGRD